jgi:hypothetical protein
MARAVNGTLYVPVFNSTINPGEYTFSGATYDNQADATGNGAYDLKTGFVLFVQATDPFLATPVPGVMHRYKLTALSIADSVTISGTVLWDEDGSEVDQPTSGSYCIITEKTSAHQFGIPSAVAVYPNLPSGADISALAVDIRNTADSLDTIEILYNDEGSLVASGKIVYKSSSTQFKLALATNASFNEGTTFGVSLDGIANGDAGRILVAPGVKVGGFSGLTANPLFLSKNTPGGVVQSLIGFVAGNHVISVGSVNGPTEILFSPEYEYEY